MVAIAQSPLKSHWVIVLCGGRGSRLGSVTESIPKSLALVHDKPIIWYTFLTLYKDGFRKFIFPLGYRGSMIEEFLTKEFDELDCEIRFIDTGEDTPISQRLHKVSSQIAEGDDFFLINGDTFFDFDILGMYHFHRRKNALATLSSVEIVSEYGILVEEDGQLTDFAREKKVSYFTLNGGKNARGHVNSGFVWLNKDALKLIDLETCKNFEQELFPKIIKRGRAVHFKIEGNWFSVDTNKDLNIINLREGNQKELGEMVKKAKENLATRYSYQSRYYGDVNELKENILNKTIIPHQVEVQPGPIGGDICWLKCPYCYGNTAQDSGERLTPERYVDIMTQIAEGGVKKVIFAGYATDPLFYTHIEDIVQVALDYNQVTGFHTKAINISDRLAKQITGASIAPLSYFSISVDSGNNETYNKVHGVPQSQAKLYDKVIANIKRLVDERSKTDAPLDISATYLLNPLNNSSEEVLKSIHDLRDAGVDLIRFTFPQVPRGYSVSSDDSNIPTHEQITEYMKRLRPLIEQENDSQCQVLILDLDGMHDVYEVPRSLPCFARYIFPSIGFDGWLSHCSESAAPHFRGLAMGNLQEEDFWDVFYNYDSNNFKGGMEVTCGKMEQLNCKCDRKEHVVNSRLKESGVFDGII
jgi:glucose-1-phosphate cytidylyltransferase